MYNTNLTTAVTGQLMVSLLRRLGLNSLQLLTSLGCI